MPKEDSQFICLSVVLIDSVFRAGKNFYPQVFLQECKYIIKEKDFIFVGLENSDEEKCDKKNSDKEDSSEEDPDEEILEKIQIKK